MVGSEEVLSVKVNTACFPAEFMIEDFSWYSLGKMPLHVFENSSQSIINAVASKVCWILLHSHSKIMLTPIYDNVINLYKVAMLIFYSVAYHQYPTLTDDIYG